MQIFRPKRLGFRARYRADGYHLFPVIARPARLNHKTAKTLDFPRNPAPPVPGLSAYAYQEYVSSVPAANDFVSFARRGELGSNRCEDEELSLLSPHLLQNCMVFVNSLTLQQVLARLHGSDRLTPRDQLAITPLIWTQVNPYGRFELDIDSRIPVRTRPPMATDARLLGMDQRPRSRSRMARNHACQ